MNGFKFLDPTGATHWNGNETVYPLPRPGEKWGPEFKHPNPSEPDGGDCGPGRWHVMKQPTTSYAPANWWPWYVKSTGILIGESKEKFGTTALRLRRISPALWHRIIGLGWCAGANLSGAHLRWANLSGANLSKAHLSGANLSGANLSKAHLSGARHNRYTQWPEAFDTGRLEEKR